MKFIQKRPTPWLLAALVAALIAFPGERRDADAAIPLLQGYGFLGVIICTGECLRNFCCSIVPAPLPPP